MLKLKLLPGILFVTITLAICNGVYGASTHKPTNYDEIDLATILNELTNDFLDPDDIFGELEALFDDLNSQVEQLFDEISSVEGPFSLFLILFD